MSAFSSEALQARIEQGRELGAPTATYLSVTGEPYVVIGHQKGKSEWPGTVDEGEPMQWFGDEQAAFFAALKSFESYAKDRTGKLYWRITPALERNGGSCVFYLRLLISDKAVA